MNDLMRKIREWFLGPEKEAPDLKPNQGQQSYKSQPVPVSTQAQEVPVELMPIKVDVAGIVPTWKMPSKHQIWKSSALLDGTRIGELLGGDYKYSRVTMWVTGVVAGQIVTGVYVGSQADLNNGPSKNGTGSVFGAQLPIDKPIVVEGNTEQIYYYQTVASVTANGPLAINYIAERWTD